MWDSVLKLVGYGAVGLAAVMLVLSHLSYRAILDAVVKSGHEASGDRFKPLIDDLKDYRRVALYALLASVVVQLAEPVLNRVFPPAAPKYELALIVDPLEGLSVTEVPVIRHEGHKMTSQPDGAFVAAVTSKSNFSIGIHGLRSSLAELQKVTVKIAQEQQAVQPDPAKRPVGFEPGP